MTGLTSSPRLTKGALLGWDIMNPLASVVVFQYNPNTMTRTLEARAAGGDGDPGEVTRLTGPPKESIKLSIEIDAADQLEKNDSVAARMGIYPALSALEMMLYPKSLDVLLNSTLSAVGMLEIMPTEAPLVFLVWGLKRVLPVRITSFSITEEAYDPSLNPILAKADLSLTVLTYQDFSVFHPGFSMFMAHQVAKEVMATLNTVNNVQNFTSVLP
jgi:hypothetical protein